jgi:TolA-binding protein
MKRLLDDGGTPFERALLGAAARELPAPMLERRMRRALGIGFIATSAKLAMALVPVAAIALFAADLSAPPAKAPPAMPRESSVSVAPVPKAPEAKVERASARSAPQPASVAEIPTPTTPAALPARRAPREIAANDLSREIRLMDQARAAVRTGSSAHALELLRSYEQRYPRGAFRQEVAVLRVEALERRGERARAGDLARKFVAENPDSPHVERVEQVTKSE